MKYWVFLTFCPPTKKFNTSCVRDPKLPATQPPLGGCSAGQLKRVCSQESDGNAETIAGHALGSQGV